MIQEVTWGNLVKNARTAINVEDTITTFCDDFGNSLLKYQSSYIYFADTCDKNGDIGTCDIGFAFQDFNEQTTKLTNNCDNAMLTMF